jgi:hypothetical protein
MGIIKEAIIQVKSDLMTDIKLSKWKDIRTFRYDEDGAKALNKVTKKVLVNLDKSFMFIDGSSPEIEKVIKQYNLEELK